ncbi:DUF1592 domain-containing protein [Haliangium sp.]|uniref:DUF1592 domain-containing protein n=1 Tax=Haliangium sp. TaxID=2663208 RepID=UPI003D10B8D9
MRRLTQVEYNNTVFQLLGDTTYPANSFVPDEEAGGFTNQASALVVSPLLAEQYLESAETLAATHSESLLADDLPACVGASVDPSACNAAAEAFIRDFGKRTFRRPLAEDEVTMHKDLFMQGAALGEGSYDPRTGLELVLQAMLQSPHFLYRIEFGESDPVEGDVVQLTSYEMASRLSFLFWGTMPDAGLFEAAEADELREPEQIEAQARRLLAAPRARDAIKNFHRQWLGLDDFAAIAAAGRDVDLYPDYDDRLLALWQEETESFIEYAIFEQDADVATLFTAPYSMMNAELAAFYGIQGGPQGAAFERVDLDPNLYAGFLTQAGLLALYSKTEATSPVQRGKFVRERLLCQAAPPPPDVVPEPPMVDTSKTTREQYVEHRENPACAMCHLWMDTIGFGFENFDAIGRYRAEQNGLPIDASGEILYSDDADGAFNGVVELAERLGNSNQVRRCVSTQWFRYAYGRAETDADTCSMDVINQYFEESAWDVKELLVGLTQTDAFRYMPRVQPEENP